MNGESKDKVLAEYEAWLRSWGASERTVQFRVWFAGGRLKEWGQATTKADIEAYLGRPGLSEWSRVTYFNALRCWCGWLTATGRLEANPTDGLRRPRTPKPKPRPLTPDEANRALRATRGKKDLHAWLLLAMLAGLRAHEIAKIRGEDVNEESIYVLGKGKQVGYQPTHPVIWELAQQYPRYGFWFPSTRSTAGHVQGDTVSDRIAACFRTVGISGSIHRARHLYGTSLLRAGTNVRVVQTLMRHASLATTESYLDVDEAERIHAVAQLTWGASDRSVPCPRWTGSS